MDDAIARSAMMYPSLYTTNVWWIRQVVVLASALLVFTTTWNVLGPKFLENRWGWVAFAVLMVPYAFLFLFGTLFGIRLEEMSTRNASSAPQSPHEPQSSRRTHGPRRQSRLNQVGEITAGVTYDVLMARARI